MTTAKRVRHGVLSIAACLAAMLGSTSVWADSGFYVGGSAGGASIEADFGNTPPIPGVPSSLDEDDTAFKVFGGFMFDLPLIELGVEAGYVDFGEPEIDILGNELSLSTTGYNLWGIAAIESGPVDLFAKLGYFSWELDAEILAASDSADGSDLGYGAGIAFSLGSLQVRGEYEVYDLDDFDVAMLSVGLVYRF